jgi:hypothetical protein
MILIHHSPVTTLRDGVALRAVGELLKAHVRGLTIDDERGLVIDVSGYDRLDLERAVAALGALTRLDVCSTDPFFRRLADTRRTVARLSAAVRPSRLIVSTPAGRAFA